MSGEKDNDNKCHKIDKLNSLETRTDNQNRRLIRIEDKIDSLHNGGLAKALQDAYDQMFEELNRRDSNEREQKLEMYEMDNNLKKYQIFFGLLGGGVSIKLLDIIYNLIIHYL